jgi:hypothetical protein
MRSNLCSGGPGETRARMATPKQMDDMAENAEKPAVEENLAAGDRISEAYWAAFLKDPRAESQVTPIKNRRLCDISRHVLRVSSRRCDRIVEIHRPDAVLSMGEALSGRMLAAICSIMAASNLPGAAMTTAVGPHTTRVDLNPTTVEATVGSKT